MAEAGLVEELRRSDYDRYLSLLFAPEDKRGALAALYAFNVELASIRERAHGSMPGEMRVQWWRDVLKSGSADAAGGNPLGVALIGAIERYRLPLAPFQNMLDARVFDLYDDAMPSRNDLEGYLGETASALIQMACLVLDAGGAADTPELSGHAGCAQGIAGLLRLLPQHLARGQCFVPAEILSAAGATREELRSDDEAAARVVQVMSALARDHWRAFLARAGTLPQALRPAFLPASLTPAYLDRIERQGAELARRSAELGAGASKFIMLWRAARGWPDAGGAV